MSMNKIPDLMDKRKSIDDDFEDKIMDLDYDSLEHIFMCLTVPERIVMENVLPKWKQASRRSGYSVKEHKCDVSIDDDFENRLLTLSFVEKILLLGSVYLKDQSTIRIISERCINITRLEFIFDEKSGVNNTKDYISTFTQLNKLVFIKIQILTMYNKHRTNFPDEIMNYLPEEINEIHLNFEDVSRQRPPIFFNLNKYKNLQSLTIRFCNLDNIIGDISKKSTLVYLDISGSWALEKSWIFDDLVNLEHIDLLGCRMIEERSISNVFPRIVETCKSLKHLELLAFVNNPHIDIVNIPEPEIPQKNWLNLKNLVYLTTCWSISEDFANKIVDYCKKLKDLTITAKSEAAAIIKLTELENLECLKLYEQKLTKEKIIAISKNCKTLKPLEIPCCKVKSTDRHERLSCPFFLDDLSKLQYLEYLDLSCIRKLQDSTIILIADKCTHLKCLKIKGLNKLTETGFDPLTSLKNLQEFVIDDNMTVTNNFVKKLKGLKVLNVRNCLNLIDAGIIQVIKNCPDLEQLTISLINNITLETIIAADLATKNRINEIVLHIYISNRMLYEAAHSKIKSQWLLVEYSFI